LCPAPAPNLASLAGDFERHFKDLAIVAPHGLRRQRVSYGELANLAGRFAAELARREVAKGDRVMIWGENGPEWVAAFFGCVLRGVLPVPLDFASGAEFARSVQQEVSPRLIVGNAKQLRALGILPAIAFEDFASVLPAQGVEAISDLSRTIRFKLSSLPATTGPTERSSTHPQERIGEPAAHRTRDAEVSQVRTPVPSHPHPAHAAAQAHVFGQFMGLWIPPLFAAELHLRTPAGCGPSW